MSNLQFRGMSPSFPLAHPSLMEKRKSAIEKKQKDTSIPPKVPEKNNKISSSNPFNNSNGGGNSSILNGSTALPSVAENETIHEHEDSQVDLSRQKSNTMSLSSNLYIEPEYNVQLVLNFSSREIKLIRDTWYEMLSDDLHQNLTDKNQTTSINHASIASSLFCIQFYANLLGMDPNLERMFPSIKHQAISFAGVLSTAIINLENLKTLDAYLQNLGKRHSRILGIDPPHFELMGTALLKTFHDRFGSNFSLELERCWARLYSYLANSILQFGIDPVLKIDKINNEWEQGFNNNTNNNSNINGGHGHSKLERTTTELTMSSTFESGRSISTSSTVNQTTKLRQPSGINPVIGNTMKQNNQSSTSLSMGAASKLNKKNSANVKNNLNQKFNGGGIGNGGNTLGTTAGSESEDEKCIIM